MTSQPDNLTAIVFMALFEGYDLVAIGATYIVYPPPVLGNPLMYISDSLGSIARQISELENPETEPDGLIAYVADPLPKRSK